MKSQAWCVKNAASWGIFALIVAGTFCGQLGLSILTPFFPAEAKSKLVKDLFFLGAEKTTVFWMEDLHFSFHFLKSLVDF